ncbi:GntP family permease, partial [Staphylococcus pseudintermedius]
QLISGHEGKAHNTLESMIYFIGSAGTAMLIAVVFAVFSMGIRRGIPTKQVMNTLTQAIHPIGMMLLLNRAQVVKWLRLTMPIELAKYSRQ